MVPIRITFGAATHPGRTRKTNQDKMAWVLSGRSDQSTSPALFVVADGMGGHRGGEEASRLAVHAVCGYYERHQDVAPVRLLESALKEANKAIRRAVKENPMLNGMGTTCTALVIGDTEVTIGHIGDSRAYLIENGSVKQITEDHLAAQDIAHRLMINVEEAWQYTPRNSLSRALGPVENVDIDVMRHPLANGQQWLLCTDGLLELTPEKMRHLLLDDMAQRAAEALVKEAVRIDGSDNATCILVNVYEATT